MYKIMITGHRKMPRKDITKLTLLEFIQREMDDHPDLVLISGMALGADTMFAQIAQKMDIPLRAYIPFPTQANRWPKAARETYAGLLGYAEKVVTVCDKYSNAAYFERNAAMVESADARVAVWDGSVRSGTGHAVRLAKKSGIDVTIINP